MSGRAAETLRRNAQETSGERKEQGSDGRSSEQAVRKHTRLADFRCYELDSHHCSESCRVQCNNAAVVQSQNHRRNWSLSVDTSTTETPGIYIHSCSTQSTDLSVSVRSPLNNANYCHQTRSSQNSTEDIMLLQLHVIIRYIKTCSLCRYFNNTENKR